MENMVFLGTAGNGRKQAEISNPHIDIEGVTGSIPVASTTPWKSADHGWHAVPLGCDVVAGLSPMLRLGG